MALLVLLGAGCALSNSSLADFKVLGLNLFDLSDALSSNIILPAGGIFIALFVGWVWGPAKFAQALGNQGQLRNASSGAPGVFPAALCVAAADPAGDAQGAEAFLEPPHSGGGTAQSQTQVMAGGALVQAQAELRQDRQQVVEDVALRAS